MSGPQLPFPFLLLLLPPSPSLIHSSSTSAQKGAVLPWCQQSMAYRVEVGLSSSACIKAGQGNLTLETGSQKPAKEEQALVPLPEFYKSDIHRGLGWSHAGSLAFGP